jgi:hypothetical protein
LRNADPFIILLGTLRDLDETLRRQQPWPPVDGPPVNFIRSFWISFFYKPFRPPICAWSMYGVYCLCVIHRRLLSSCLSLFHLRLKQNTSPYLSHHLPWHRIFLFFILLCIVSPSIIAFFHFTHFYPPSMYTSDLYLQIRQSSLFFFFTSTEATHHAGPSIARIVLQIYRGTVTLLLLWVLGGCFGDGLDSNGPITWHNQTDSFFSRDVVRWVSHLVISFFLFRTNSICILVMRLSRSGFGEWEDLVWSLVYRDARECACWFLVHTR